MTTELLEKNGTGHKAINTTVATHPEDYQVRIIRSVAEFSPMKAEWDGFLNRAGIQNLSMTHGWMTTWLQQFPADELLIIIIQNKESRWLGVAPLKINRGSHGVGQKALLHLQFIGTQPNVYDWMKVVALPNENEAAIVRKVAEVIRKSRWDILDFQFVRSKAQCEIFLEVLQPGQPEDAIVTKTAIPYLELPATVEDYEKVRRKKTRLEVNRHCNRFAKEFGTPPELAFQSACEASEAALSRFISAHIKYWAERKEKSDFQRFPKLGEFYKNMLAYSEFKAEPDEPKLLFSILVMGEYQLSYHLGFWQGNGYLSHITNFNQGFRSYSPGTIHMDQLVFETIERGGQIFEFGRGDEPYKHMWTREKERLWNLRLFRSPLAKALWGLDNRLKKLVGKAAE